MLGREVVANRGRRKIARNTAGDFEGGLGEGEMLMIYYSYSPFMRRSLSTYLSYLKNLPRSPWEVLFVYIYNRFDCE
jgi:hypothetical protein